MATTKGPRSNRNEIKNKIYKIPNTLSPWAKGEENNSGTVWIRMRPRRILDQYSKGADAPISTVDTGVLFQFIAPLAVGEHIVHNWEAYESVASRLAQKARTVVKFSEEVSLILLVLQAFVLSLKSSVLNSSLIAALYKIFSIPTGM